MYYILSPDISLRSWRLVPYGYYIKGLINPGGASKEDFETMLLCDALHDIEDSKTVENLKKQRIIIPCKKGEFKLTEWQKHKSYNNRLMPRMNIQITGKCNYNCRHCFNAADNAPLQSEISYEEMIKLLDEARDCGINSFTITGGEPFVHKQFKEIMAAIYEKNMFVFELNTNGYYINQEVLDYMKQIGCKPLMKISFDGIGYHDWMRQRKGAEKDAVRAIKLCIKNGFEVMAQVQINAKNKNSMSETFNLLDSIGVKVSRIIRTTETPRWAINASGQTLDVSEYYDAALELTGEYIKSPRNMELTFWKFLNVYPDSKTYSIAAMPCNPNTYRESVPLCKSARGMIAIGANGNVYPCLQMSGYLDAQNIKLGNIKEQSLKELLQDSKYLDYVCQTVHDRVEKNGKCKDCKHLKYCAGGCPAIGLLSTGDILGADSWRCVFYENDYLQKIKTVLENYNITKG